MRKKKIVVFLISLFLFMSAIHHSSASDQKLVSVYQVYKSDTISVRENPKNNWDITSYKLAGIKTPRVGNFRGSKNEPLALEAGKFLEQSIIDGKVYIEVASKFRYDNYAYIWVDFPPDSSDATIRSTMLNALIISQGLAKFDSSAINDQKKILPHYQRVFEQLQQEAQEARIGIWGLPATKEKNTSEEIEENGTFPVYK